MLQQTLMDSWEAAKAVGPDIMILGSKGGLAEPIAEKLGIPVIMAMPFPQIVPTAETPSIGFPHLNIGGWYNFLTYKVVNLIASLYGGVLNEFRQNILSLDKKPRSVGLMQRADGQPIPQLHCFSKHVMPRPNDWPDYAYVNGYWFLNRLDGWKPPAELEAFLYDGEAPVYVGFGSMAGKNPKRLTDVVIEALQQANVRGIIATGWGGIDADKLPDSIFKIDDGPHDWLFPRVAAVVHHGGAGTTGAGLRAGRPTIICPFIGDQSFWGQRVHSLGVGCKPIPKKKLTVMKLADAIQEVIQNKTIRQNADALGEKIRDEDGIANAITTIENIRFRKI